VKKLKDEIATLKKQLANERSARITEVNQVRETATAKQVQQAKDKANVEKEKVQLEQKLTEKHKKEIEETKKKQWCAGCLKESIYFCCWNTSYCGFECQSAHWPNHMTVCQQGKTQSANPSSAPTTSVASSKTASKSGSTPVSASAASVTAMPVTSAHNTS
jgi:hypothetical protein